MQADFKVVPILYMGEALEIRIRDRAYLFSPVPMAAHKKFLYLLTKNKGRAVKWLEKRVGKGMSIGERRGVGSEGQT